jgi:3-dehydroquinate dehydratase
MSFLKDLAKGTVSGLGAIGYALKSRSKRKAKKEQDAFQAAIDEQKRMAKGSREAMLKDVQSGRKFGKEILGEEGLGKLGEKQSMKDVLSRRRQQMEEGIPAQEQEAFRSKLLKQMQAAEQRQGLALGSQLGGARGAGAVAQMRSLQQAGLAKRADIETDLFLKQQQAKREGLSAFEQTATEQEKFDIKQAAKEKGIEMAAGMGFGQMGSAERSAAASAQSAITAAQLQKRKPGIVGQLIGGLF